MENGRAALVLFFGLFWGGVIAVVGRYRPFDTTAFFHKTASGRAVKRFFVALLVLNLLPIGWLWFLYFVVVPDAQGLASIIVAAIASLSMFGFHRLFHAFICSDTTYQPFYTEDEKNKVLEQWNPSKFPVVNKFTAHFVPGLSFLIAWPLVAWLLRCLVGI